MARAALDPTPPPGPAAYRWRNGPLAGLRTRVGASARRARVGVGSRVRVSRFARASSDPIEPGRRTPGRGAPFGPRRRARARADRRHRRTDHVPEPADGLDGAQGRAVRRTAHARHRHAPPGRRLCGCDHGVPRQLDRASAPRRAVRVPRSRRTQAGLGRGARALSRLGPHPRGRARDGTQDRQTLRGRDARGVRRADRAAGRGARHRGAQARGDHGVVGRAPQRARRDAVPAGARREHALRGADLQALRCRCDRAGARRSVLPCARHLRHRLLQRRSHRGVAGIRARRPTAVGGGDPSRAGCEPRARALLSAARAGERRVHRAARARGARPACARSWRRSSTVSPPPATWRRDSSSPRCRRPPRPRRA